jgi:hypothetical protein
VAHDKSVIVTLFDADMELPWWQSARRIREYPHYQKLLALGGVVPVSTFGELSSEIKRFLDNPDRLAAQRRASLYAECGAIDGGASARVALALKVIGAEVHSRSSLT